MISKNAQTAANGSLLATIAWMYHVEGRTQADIAQRFGVSRPTIISYLQRARALGIVQVEIDRGALCREDVSRRLKDVFALQEVYVLSTPRKQSVTAEADRVMAIQTVASFAGALLPDLVSPGDRLGVSWGETVYHLSEAMPSRPVEQLTAVQLIGAMHSPLVSTAEAAAETIARKLNGRCINLHVPAVVSSAQLARELRKEPIIKAQFEIMNSCNKTVTSVGACIDVTHIVQSGIADTEVMKDYAARGAVGILHCRFIDAQGRHIRGPLDERLLGVDLERLHHPEMGLLVAASAVKAQATLAAIRGGFVTHLVADEALAETMLALLDRSDAEPRRLPADAAAQA